MKGHTLQQIPGNHRNVHQRRAHTRWCSRHGPTTIMRLLENRRSRLRTDAECSPVSRTRLAEHAEAHVLTEENRVSARVLCAPSRFSRASLFATLWTVAHQAPLSTGKNTAVGCHAFPSKLPDPGVQLHLLCPLNWQGLLYHECHLGSLLSASDTGGVDEGYTNNERL